MKNLARDLCESTTIIVEIMYYFDNVSAFKTAAEKYMQQS